MAEVYIPSKDLIEVLKISSQELIDIEIFFDSIADDEWELVEGKDYRIVNKASKLREYTSSGAHAIARYLETEKKKSFFQLIKDWFFQTKQKIRRAFVRSQITGNSSSIIKRSDRFYLSRSDVVSIFKTRSDYLSKMADYARRTKPLIENVDYIRIVDDGIYYSLSGIYKLSLAFRESIKCKNRKVWCSDVGEIIEPHIEEIIASIKDREKRVEKVKNKVRKYRDKNTCQVTLRKGNAIEPLELAVHHLFSKSNYPNLADVESNLITVSGAVHNQFHQEYMGGTINSCTIDDFIDFVRQRYPESSKVLIWLEQQKLNLGNPQPIDLCKPHVLYLPASRFA